ncbi:MAG: DUF5694 domain-containing protein [Bacteroidota bacterium]
MKTINLLFLLLAVALAIYPAETPAQTADNTSTDPRIPVLNLGVFHMGATSDANSTEYDESAEENVRQIAAVCEQLATFRPTVICLETTPKNQEFLSKAYADYLADPTKDTPYADSEIQLLGFAAGQLAGAERVFAIDHRMSYNYDLSELAERVNATEYFRVLERLQSQFEDYEPAETLGKTLAQLNTPAAYDFLIAINADMLTFANSPEGFEGADEAAKFYQRNLRMFANINKLPLTEEDRVLIISGATHAAFFDEFLRRSTRYRSVRVTDYLPK